MSTEKENVLPIFDDSDDLNVDIIEPDDVDTDTELTPEMSQSDQQELDTEMEEAKANFKKILKVGIDSIEDVKDLAQASDHPRAWEVLGGMLSTLSGINAELVSLQQTKHKIKKDLGLPEGTTVNTGDNNSVFIGSTKDLQKMMAEMEKKNK